MIFIYFILFCTITVYNNVCYNNTILGGDFMENSLNKECKGNLLKNVISRIDFDDLYYVDKDILKRIKKVCDGFGLKLNMILL
jgi:hypothetical protein